MLNMKMMMVMGLKNGRKFMNDNTSTDNEIRPVCHEKETITDSILRQWAKLFLSLFPLVLPNKM